MVYQLTYVSTIIICSPDNYYDYYANRGLQFVEISFHSVFIGLDIDINANTFDN